MRRSEMTSKVNAELKHIPRGLKSSPQNWMREYYNAARRHDLKENPETPARETLRKVIEHIKKDNPDFVPRYDAELLLL